MQNTWRKIQCLGHLHLYREYADVNNFCGMLDAFAFMPIGDVVYVIQYLRENIPDRLEPLIDYFNNTYIYGLKVGIMRFSILSDMKF